MVPTVSVIISLVIDPLELFVEVKVHVTVVYVNATQDGQVNHVIAML